jgi:FKBP-type peptidyl-prolyl cis-trans isomerase
MRIALLAGMAVLLAACGEKPATDGASAPASTETATPAETTATPPATLPPAGGKAVDAAAFAKYVPWNHAHPDVKKSGSGMEYVILASGPAGGKGPTKDQDVEVFYEGRFNSDNKKFDSAFERGESSTFGVARVVPGFSEALQMMKPGDRWLVFVPGNLGYGPAGRAPVIPPNADLVFEIDMVAVH